MHPFNDLLGAEQPVVRGGRKFGRRNLPDHVPAENFNHRHVCRPHTEQIVAQGKYLFTMVHVFICRCKNLLTNEICRSKVTLND